MEVAVDLLDRLAYGDRDQGIVIVAQMPESRLDGLDLPADPLIGVIERIEKPGNIGAILRSADGAGLNAVIVADPRTDPWNPNPIRASLGTVFTVPLAVAPAADVRVWLRERGIRVVTARDDAAREYTDENLRRVACDEAALGSEAEGLGALWGGPDANGGAHPDARRGGQPQRVGERGDPVLRGAPAAERARTQMVTAHAQTRSRPRAVALARSTRRSIHGTRRPSTLAASRPRSSPGAVAHAGATRAAPESRYRLGERPGGHGCCGR